MATNTPASPQRKPEYGSDLVVDLMNAVGIEYAALNPGATFRGIHDSIVNYGGNQRPELIQCCHEEVSVAIAHGYAKAAGKPMAAICHNIVGLQHASMAVFNAWCDRAPVMVMGGTGPMDSTQRRPWIDWIHTALVQGQVVRDYVKWDDQPASVAAIPESFLRGYRLAMTEPQAPVYLCYDSELQEAALAQSIAIPPVEKYIRPSRFAPEPARLEEAAAALAGAEFPVIVVDMVGRQPGVIPALVQLAEVLSAPVIDMGNRFNFPSSNPLDLSDAREEMLRKADVVLVLEAQDAYGALRSPPAKKARGTQPWLGADTRVINIALSQLNTRAWAADYEEIQPADIDILADTSLAVPALLGLVQARLQGEVSGRSARQARAAKLADQHQSLRARARATAQQRSGERPIAVPWLTARLWEAVRHDPWVLANGNASGWARRLWDIDQPQQWLGTSGGAGLGYGPGGAAGVALAHRGQDKLCVNLQADGDFLFTATALWTAAHHRLPLLTVMVNNRTYYNSEQHQELMASMRGRSTANKTVGIRIEDPNVDYAAMARSQGVHGIGPVTDPAQVDAALAQAVDYVKRERLPVVVDVVVASV